MSKKIVIYDNNPVTITGLKHILIQKNYEVVGTTTDPEELLRCILLMKPNFVIIDPLYMREEYISRLRKVHEVVKNFQFIIFAGSESVYHFLRSCRLIWMAYLSKNQPLEALFEVLCKPQNDRAFNIDSLQANSQFLSETSLMQKSLRSLTGREMQVFREIGAGKTNKIIADEMCLSNKTISTYKRNIMDKLDTNDVREIVDIARRHGF